jgi:hypothetical protein
VSDWLDTRDCSTGLEVADEHMESLNIVRDRFHGKWNYAFHTSISLRRLIK